MSPRAQFPSVSPIYSPSRWEHPEFALPLGSKRAARGPQGMCCYVYAQQEIKHLRSSISYTGPETNSLDRLSPGCVVSALGAIKTPPWKTRPARKRPDGHLGSSQPQSPTHDG